MESKDNQKISALMTENDLIKLREELGYAYVKDVQAMCQKLYKRKYASVSIRKGLTKRFASDKIIKAALTVRNNRRIENREFIDNYLR